MSVIGRLDKQVEEVLINPLSERRRREHEEHEDVDPTPSDIKQPEDSRDNRPRNISKDLPVWML